MQALRESAGRGILDACARSSSTPKPPGSSRSRAIASSKSAASSCSTGARPAARSIATCVPTAKSIAARCRCTASPTNSSRSSRASTEIVDELLEFINGAELIIHNAAFDIAFLDAELQRLPGAARQDHGPVRVLDTLPLARQMHPGQRNSLDALCKRYGVDNSHRELHGALLDAQILLDVYLAMTGGQTALILGEVRASRTCRSRRAGHRRRGPRGVLRIVRARDRGAGGARA